MSDYWDHGDDWDWDYWDDYGEAAREDAWRDEMDEEERPRHRRRKRRDGLLKKIVDFLKYSLVIILLLSFLTASTIPVLAQSHHVPSSSGYKFSYRLLGLSKNLYGVHAEPGWMLIVGEGGLITEAKNLNGMWVYEPIAIGGAKLMDVIWREDRGLAIGEGVAMLLEKIGETITARQLPFLVDKYLVASWNPSRKFAAIVGEGAIYYYEPGAPTAMVIARGYSPLFILKPYKIEKLIGEDCAALLTYRQVSKQTEHGRAEKRTVIYLTKVCGPDKVEHEEISEGKDLSEALELFQKVARKLAEEAEPSTIGIKHVSLLRIIAEVLKESMNVQGGGRSRRSLLLIGAYGVHGNQTIMATVFRSVNLLYVYKGNGSKIYSLPFPLQNVYPFEENDKLYFAVVGDGGGVAVVDPDLDSAIYCSVPSANKIAFLDENTAAITSPYGLFIYNYTSVEYFPMPSPPTSVNVGSRILIADESGQIYEFIRPQPWKGGITLSNVIQGGKVIDIETSAEGEVLLVRSEESEVAAFGKKSAIFYLKDTGIERVESPILGKDVELTDMVAFGDGKTLLVGLGGKIYKLTGSTLEPIPSPEADYYVAARSPVAPIAIIAGAGIVLIYDAEDDSIDRVPAPPTALLSAAFSLDGSYALIGGAGALLAYDVNGLHEVAQKHVVEYLYLAAKPNSQTFLASTSLGLMEIKEEARPNYDPITAEGYYHIIGSGLVELKYRAISSKALVVDDYRVECSVTCDVESVSIPKEFRPLKIEDVTVRLSFDEEDVPKTGNITAFIKFITPDNEIYKLPAVSFRPVFASGISLEAVFSPAIIQPVIIIAVIVILAIAVVKFLRKERRRTSEFGEESERLPREWPRKKFGDEMGDEFLD